MSDVIELATTCPLDDLILPWTYIALCSQINKKEMTETEMWYICFHFLTLFLSAPDRGIWGPPLPSVWALN